MEFFMYQIVNWSFCGSVVYNGSSVEVGVYIQSFMPDLHSYSIAAMKKSTHFVGFVGIFVE